MIHVRDPSNEVTLLYQLLTKLEKGDLIRLSVRILFESQVGRRVTYNLKIWHLASRIASLILELIKGLEALRERSILLSHVCKNRVKSSAVNEKNYPARIVLHLLRSLRRIILRESCCIFCGH
ncbi:hypothetical protein AVEN_177071-1 [Araneus ventricosus]|uniref:Uncharacterized protein n=1 Tax=Araneus ventricosus TaxID=182803 RepID=A0A4Y2CT46_ARAVE|nr:hypothetical protein AVEN_177071-1 [Araneus ventricosus]